MGESNYEAYRPYSDIANDEQLYAVAEHWKDDIDYFKGEIRFLHHLMEKVFAQVIALDGKGKTDDLIARLSHLHLEREALAAKVNVHLRDFAVLESRVLNTGANTFRQEHKLIEAKMVGFWKSFRAIKKDIFELAASAMKSDKLLKLEE